MGADLATRAQVISLKAFTQKTFAEIAYITGLSDPTTRRIFARAIERGFEPDVNPVILDEYVKDAPRSGRPTKQDTVTKDSVLSKVRRDRYRREKTCADLAGELSIEGIDISATTIQRILWKAGFHKTKPTRKPRLTKKMKAERLKQCLDHEH